MARVKGVNGEESDNPCGSTYEHDHYNLICNLEDGHKEPHESAWFEWPNGQKHREQWTDEVHVSSVKDKA